MKLAQSGVIFRQKCFKSPGGRGDVIKGASRQKLSINESTFFLIVPEHDAQSAPSCLSGFLDFRFSINEKTRQFNRAIGICRFVVLE